MSRIKLNLVLLFLAFALPTFTSCESEEYSFYEVDRIVGSWKLMEVYNENGQWIPAENAYKYTFHEDGTFISTRFSQCTTGNYHIENEEIFLEFDCSNNRMKGITSSSSTFIEEFNYEGMNVIFIPINSTCDQGCKLKFKPIN